MDILTLIDQLDDMVRKARPVPLTDQIRLERRPIYDLLDQIRGELVRAGHPPAAAIDGSALKEAVSAAIRDNIPEIARAVAAEPSTRPPQPPQPPGGPF